MKDNRKIKVVANTRPSNHWGGNVYDINGLCPTVTSSSTIKNGLKIMEKDNRKIKLIGSYNGHQSGNIYDKNGLSPSLCCTDYKSPLKIVEIRGGNSMNKNIIDNNFTEVKKGKYITTDRERERVLNGVDLLVDYIKPYKLMCYVLIGYWSSPEEDLERVMYLWDTYKIHSFVMPYNKFDRYQKDFARWCNNKIIFKTRSWEEYKNGNR